MSEGAPKQSWVVQTTEATFERDVFERSRGVPVVVDFWAEWCAPCRMLGPVLEQLAAEYGGRFVLVKADTEAVPREAAGFGVQSIPAVFAVLDGEVVSSFAGAIPEPQIRSWLDQVLGEAEVGQLEQLERSDPAAAEQRYRELIRQRPNDARPAIGLARLLAGQERDEEARACLARLEERGFLEPEAESIKSALELKARGGADPASCRRAVEENPDDLPARLALAEALAGSREYEGALQICLDLVERDREGAGEPARQLMLDIFRVLPPESDLLRESRRRLARLLY
jgi:putative thioredoxin